MGDCKFKLIKVVKCGSDRGRNMMAVKRLGSQLEMPIEDLLTSFPFNSFFTPQGFCACV